MTDFVFSTHTIPNNISTSTAWPMPVAVETRTPDPEPNDDLTWLAPLLGVL